jgi:hypothetical protein
MITKLAPCPDYLMILASSCRPDGHAALRVLRDEGVIRAAAGRGHFVVQRTDGER